MIFGDLVGLKFPDICVTGEEKPKKKLIHQTSPYLGSNPSPLRNRRMLPAVPQRWVDPGGPVVIILASGSEVRRSSTTNSGTKAAVLPGIE